MRALGRSVSSLVSGLLVCVVAAGVARRSRGLRPPRRPGRCGCGATTTLAQPAGLRLLALERALGAVDGAAADHPTYAGTAVHDFTGWAALGP